MADAGRYGLRYRRQEGQKREEEEGACMEWKSRRGRGEEEEGACKEWKSRRGGGEEEEGACMEWKSRRGGGEEEEGACKGGIAGSNFRLGSYKDANGQLMADRLPFLWS